MEPDYNPFQDPAPREIHLNDSPLVRVIVQVQFPAQLNLVERSAIGEIQKLIGNEFPVLEEQKIQNFMLNLGLGDTDGRIQPQISPEIQWRFSHPETGFVLQINSTSITFETSRYTSRQDFFQKFLNNIEKIHSCFPIQFASRLGVRYVDRVPHSRCPDVHRMIRDGFGGISKCEFAQPVEVDVHEFQLQVPHEDGTVHGRIGFLPPGGTIDPVTCPPLQEKNWILDLDLFRFRPNQFIPFVPKTLSDDASAFALRIYAIFRWIVNDDFLKTFGGHL